jgi:hypothetical protein
MNATRIDSQPETVTGGEKLAAQLLDKNDLARLLKLSPRSISNWMERGMPHLRLGERRVRFIQEDTLAWLKANYSCSRIGKLNARA